MFLRRSEILILIISNAQIRLHSFDIEILCYSNGKVTVWVIVDFKTSDVVKCQGRRYFCGNICSCDSLLFIEESLRTDEVSFGIRNIVASWMYCDNARFKSKTPFTFPTPSILMPSAIPPKNLSWENISMFPEKSCFLGLMARLAPVSKKMGKLFGRVSGCRSTLPISPALYAWGEGKDVIVGEKTGSAREPQCTWEWGAVMGAKSKNGKWWAGSKAGWKSSFRDSPSRLMMSW